MHCVYIINDAILFIFKNIEFHKRKIILHELGIPCFDEKTLH